jgi:predicted ribosomally synthesized peptide with nif11-like leader
MLVRIHGRKNNNGKENKMSKENVQKFYELLKQDPAVVNDLQKAVEVADNTEKAACCLVEFAGSKGFDFTVDELAQFEVENRKELTPEELEKINAAGGGYCLGVGAGWGEGYGLGYTKCFIIGKGIGISWSDTNDLENEEGNRMAKDIVEVVSHAASKIKVK